MGDPRSPTQHGSDPGQKLLEAKGLGQVVVAAEPQPPDAVLDPAAGRQEHHGYPASSIAQGFEHPKAVEAGEHEVQDHQVVGRPQSGVQAVGPGKGLVHRKPLVPKPPGQGAGELEVVFDDQDAHDLSPSPLIPVGARTG